MVCTIQVKLSRTLGVRVVSQRVSPVFVRFANFELNLRSGELRQDETLVKLPPQPSKVLVLLVCRAGEIVPRQEIVEHVWSSKTFVDFEQGLSFAIRQIRMALGDDADHPRFLETRPKRGYCFIAPVQELLAPAEEEARSAPVLPEQKARFPWRYAIFFAGIVVTALLSALAWKLVSQRLRGRPGGHRIESLAVLPLRSLSPDREHEYFSDGMTDELISALSNSKGVRVISHTSVERYKGTTRSLPEIARELGVDGIVEGTVTRSGDRIRIAVQLIDGRSDQHVWAERYEGDLRDVLALQDEVARQVAYEVGTTLTTASPSVIVRKVDPLAHEAYLKGVFYFGQMTCLTFGKAVKAFEEAVDRDPTYAPAYASLAEARFQFAKWRCSHEVSFDQAQAAALRAIALDANSAAAEAVLAEIAFSYEWNWTKAAAAFSKAIRMDPNDAAIHASYGYFLVAMGKEKQGLAELQRAHQIDPVSEQMNIMDSTALFMAHHFDEAIDVATRALELSPGQYGQYYWLGECYEKKGMPDQAITNYLQVWGGMPEEIPLRRAAYQKRGLRGYWELDEQLRRAEKGPETDAFYRAMYYAHEGDNSKALEQLQLAYRLRCSGLELLKVDPHFDALRDNPDFKLLLAQLAL